jgi:arylsulfatase A-like enzyme
MSGGVTRRRFVQASAGAAVTAAIDPAAFAKTPDGPNILLIVVDSLRADAVYEDWVRTPTMSALTRRGLHFTHVHPEAMPTVPARNSIHTGRRQFPFRGWHDRDGLLDAPGWQPFDHVDRSLLATLRRAGYFTTYVTDNPFLGYAPPYGRFRQSVNRFVRTGGQIGGHKPVSSVPDHILNHWVHPSYDTPKSRARVGKYLANSHPWKGPDYTFAGRVFRNAVNELTLAARQRGPFAMVVDTYEPHEPWTPPPRFSNMYGRWHGPEPAQPRYGRASSWLPDPRGRRRLIGRMRDLYAAEVTMTDWYLGHLIDRLHDLNLERETVIALVADHGILLGEHGWTGKIQTALYPALARVPLVFVHPERRRAGAASDWFASTHDVAPTLLSMAGVKRPGIMSGADLSPLFHGRKLPERKYAYGGYSDSFYIRSHDWMLWGFNRPGNFQLYNLRRDPGMEHNVVRSHPEMLSRLYWAMRNRAGGRLPWYGGIQ